MYWVPSHPPDPSDKRCDQPIHTSGAGFWGSEPPSADDEWLIQVVYETIATRAECAKCGAALGRGLRLISMPALYPTPRWRVSVVTRCRGWRRHSHSATVARPSMDIALGAFRPTAWRSR